MPAPHVDRVIAALAARQHGAVSRRQLLEAGATRTMIDRRLRTGRLHGVFRGVYAVGHPALSTAGRLRAALLAAGDGAVLSHRTAAGLWRVLPFESSGVDVTLAGRVPRPRAGLRVHQTLRRPAIRHVDGLPLTAPRRTLEDLAAVTRPSELQRAWTEAAALRLVRPEEIPITLDAAPTRSEVERRFLEAVRAARLPEPLVNHRIGAVVVDFAWLDPRVIVETDGWATHGHRAAFEKDRARDSALAAAGYQVLRFTWRQLEREPLLVVARLAGTIARRA